MKFLGYLGIVVLGLIVIMTIDHLIGIEFTDEVSRLTRSVHRVIYILWGSALLSIYRKLYS